MKLTSAHISKAIDLYNESSFILKFMDSDHIKRLTIISENLQATNKLKHSVAYCDLINLLLDNNSKPIEELKKISQKDC